MINSQLANPLVAPLNQPFKLFCRSAYVSCADLPNRLLCSLALPRATASSLCTSIRIPPTSVGGSFRSFLQQLFSSLRRATRAILEWRGRLVERDLNHPPTAVGGIRIGVQSDDAVALGRAKEQRSVRQVSARDVRAPTEELEGLIRVGLLKGADKTKSLFISP